MKQLRADQEELGIKMFKEQLGIKGGSLARDGDIQNVRISEARFFPNVPNYWKPTKVSIYNLIADDADDFIRSYDFSGLHVICSPMKYNGVEWLHVSFSRKSRIPDYKDIQLVRKDFIGTDKKSIMVFPDEAHYVNIAKYCLHLWYSADNPLPVGDIEYHWYLRAGGCGLISFCIFFFGRKGLAWALMIYACTLIYINNFYNYATIFFVLVAMGADPKLKKVAPWIYLTNVFIAFSLKRFGITPFLIHVVYCVMFYTKIGYVFAVHKPETLNLTHDEKLILEELAKGKLQKQIDLYSQQTISGKLKNARERNLIETTPDLVQKFKIEYNID